MSEGTYAIMAARKTLSNANQYIYNMRKLNAWLTFIRAFESFPVHCSKFCPSGNLRSLGKMGTAEILETLRTRQRNKAEFCLPMVNVLGYLTGTHFVMFNSQIFVDPSDYVVLERSLYDLMEEVGGKELMNIGLREVVGKGLERWIRGCTKTVNKKMGRMT